jgi:PhnB protein
MSSVAPAGYTSVAPLIVTPDTGRLLEFIASSFDGEELTRIPLEDGSIGYAEIRVGDTVLLAFDQRPDWPALPALLRVFVADADESIARALTAGAELITRALTQAFGQRVGRVRDPFGNIWWISTVVEEVSPGKLLHRLGEPQYERAMREAQETLDRQLGGSEHGSASPPA